MLPKIFLKDIRLVALSQIAKDELVNLRDAIYQLQLHDIDTVHESFLPFLAWVYRADEWNNEWPIERKRNIVKDALLLFRYKGTIWAVERALELSGYESVVTPWYEMTPEGERGTFYVQVFPALSNSKINRVNYELIFNLIEANKQGSQHWKGIITHTAQGGMYDANVVQSRRRYIVRNF